MTELPAVVRAIWSAKMLLRSRFGRRKPLRKIFWSDFQILATLNCLSEVLNREYTESFLKGQYPQVPLYYFFLTLVFISDLEYFSDLSSIFSLTEFFF